MEHEQFSRVPGVDPMFLVKPRDFTGVNAVKSNNGFPFLREVDAKLLVRKLNLQLRCPRVGHRLSELAGGHEVTMVSVTKRFLLQRCPVLESIQNVNVIEEGLRSRSIVMFGQIKPTFRDGLGKEHTAIPFNELRSKKVNQVFGVGYAQLGEQPRHRRRHNE